VRTLGQCLCPTWRYGDVDLENTRVATPRPLAGRSLGDFTLLHKALKLRSLFGYRRQVSLAVQRNIFSSGSACDRRVALL